MKNSIAWLRLTCFAQFAGIFVVIALIVWQIYLFNKQLDDINSKLSFIQKASTVLTVEVQDIKDNVKNLNNRLKVINNRLDNIEKYLEIRP